MEQPRRIQRKRSKGFKMPKNTVYVGRPSKWGNPFEVGSMQYSEFSGVLELEDIKKYFKVKTGIVMGVETVIRVENQLSIPLKIEDCLFLYEKYLARGIYPLSDYISKLKGKNLACWCKLDEPCHADILLKLANK
jgi:hypothetical protein